MTNFNNMIRMIVQFESDRGLALAKVMDEVLMEFNAQTGTLHLLDAGRGILKLAAAQGLPPHILELTREIPIGKGIAGECAKTGEPVTMCNLQTDTSGVAKPAAKQTGVGGSLCVPLKKGDQVVGTLGIGTRREYEFTARETRDLLHVAEVLAAELVADPAPAPESSATPAS